MSKFPIVVWLSLLAVAARAESKLTPVELKWLDAAEPVLAYASDLGLPLDIIVQPVSTDSDPPLATGVRNSRCLLILSLRDKPDAEATLANEPVERHSMLIEAMVAHELAHCWRYSKGMWHRWPAAFAESATESQDSDANLTRQAMRATQREEAFADLVALAWVKRTRADDYSQVYAWLERIRADQPLEGSFHDTRPWLTLAKDAAAFATGTSPFEAANEVWAKGF